MDIGEIVTAKAIEVLSFGVKFKLREEMILVKIPDLSWYPGPLSEEEPVKVGEEHDIKILHKVDNEYIGSLKEAKPNENPWLHPPELDSVLEGYVTTVTEYGYLIRVQNILGLLHLDEAHNTYSINQKIKVRVFSIESERKRVRFSEVKENT